MLRAIAKLLKNGVSVSRLKVALAALREHHREITPTSLPAALLVTDGHEVYLRRSRDALEGLNRGQFAFAFIVELAVIQREVIAGFVARSSTKKRRAFGT
jgi:hypothetical protein